MKKQVSNLLESRVRPLLKKENLLLLIFGGILLLVISIPTGGRQKKSADEVEPQEGMTVGEKMQEQTESTIKSWEDGEDLAYRSMLETELEELLETMEGAGDVRVMITLGASRELIVDRDGNSSHKRTTEADSAGGSRLVEEVRDENNCIYVGSGQEKNPFVTQTRYPEVEGVVVVAQGGGNSRLRAEISETVQVLFGIGAHKVKVLKMGNIQSPEGIE